MSASAESMFDAFEKGMKGMRQAVSELGPPPDSCFDGAGWRSSVVPGVARACFQEHEALASVYFDCGEDDDGRLGVWIGVWDNFDSDPSMVRAPGLSVSPADSTGRFFDGRISKHPKPLSNTKVSMTASSSTPPG